MKVVDRDTGKSFFLNSTPELAEDLDKCGQVLNCLHVKQEVRRYVDAGGASHMKRQCVACGISVGSSIAKAIAPKDVPDWDTCLRDRVEAKYCKDREDIIQKHIALQKRRESSWHKRYSEHLRSPEWAEIRRRVFRRSAGVCEGCGSAEAKEVHHISYDNMGMEFLFQLVAVCSKCHDRLHPNDDVEPPCCDCIWGENYNCLKFKLPLEQALAAEGPCGPKRGDFEPYK